MVWRKPLLIAIIREPQHPSQRFPLRGQVAQLVERSPEKAGVGGSIPSLATIVFNHLCLIFISESSAFPASNWNTYGIRGALLFASRTQRRIGQHGGMWQVVQRERRSDETVTRQSQLPTNGLGKRKPPLKTSKI